MSAIVENETWVEVDGPMGWEYVPRWNIHGEVTEYLNPGKTVGDGKTWAGYEYDGDAIEPTENLRDYFQNEEIWFLRIRKGWGARMADSVDGSSVFETEKEAWEYIHQEYCSEFESYCERDDCAEE